MDSTGWTPDGWLSQATVLERVVMTAERSVHKLSRAGGVRLATNIQVMFRPNRAPFKTLCNGGHSRSSDAAEFYVIFADPAFGSPVLHFHYVC